MANPTIDTVERCVVCGSPIWSVASRLRGYGGECAQAMQEAKAKRVFADPNLKANYYRIEAELLINRIATKTFRAGFRKSFQETLIKQATWLSKRQKEIATDILFAYDGEALRNYTEELKRVREAFWDSIPITLEDIEIARQGMRKKRGKDEER